MIHTVFCPRPSTFHVCWTGPSCCGRRSHLMEDYWTSQFRSFVITPSILPIRSRKGSDAPITTCIPNRPSISSNQGYVHKSEISFKFWTSSVSKELEESCSLSYFIRKEPVISNTGTSKTGKSKKRGHRK
jgi:hypothetical protein